MCAPHPQRQLDRGRDLLGDRLQYVEGGVDVLKRLSVCSLACGLLYSGEEELDCLNGSICECQMSCDDRRIRVRVRWC